MFTSDSIIIRVCNLLYSFFAIVYGVIAPVLVHKIGNVKWLLLFFLVVQAAITAAVAGAVYPNKLQAWISLTGIGVPMFTRIIIIAYTIASLHVPHSRLGVAMGLLGTFRSAGGAVGNAIYNTVFNNHFNSYVGPAVSPVALQNGLNPQDLPRIIPAVIQYNLGVPHTFDGIEGATPAVQKTLQVALQSAYGHAFMIVFLASLGPTLFGLICGFFVEDSSPYLTNHVQSAMSTKRQDQEVSASQLMKTGAIHLEHVSNGSTEHTDAAVKHN